VFQFETDRDLNGIAIRACFGKPAFAIMQQGQWAGDAFVCRYPEI
jgi:hypothetical protein